MPTRPEGITIGSLLLASSLPLLLAASPVQVAVTIATSDGEAVTDAAWMDARLAQADGLFARAKLRFERVATTTAAVADSGGDIMTVAQRHALAAHAPTDGRVHVFVVDKLADKDRKGGLISGVHWHYAGGKRAWRGRRYIILSRWSAIDTLAHELGHFFGLPHTTKKQNTLMTSPGRIAGAVFSARQIRIIAWNYKRYLRTRRLRAFPSVSGRDTVR
jgi:hypothetical protein